VRRNRHHIIALLCLWGTHTVVSAQGMTGTQADTTKSDSDVTAQVSGDVITYLANFFARYQPNTALDMVQQVPGFNINNGGAQRGFGTSLGNILIDDRRPSTKQDSPSNILGRIPAARVERIELIKGVVRDIDMQGFPQVVNVILKREAPVAVRWQSSVGKNLDNALLPVAGNISLSHRWQGIDYNAGIQTSRFVSSRRGIEQFYNPDGILTEERTNVKPGKEFSIGSSLNASAWFGDTLIQLNNKLELEKENSLSRTHYLPVAGETGRDVIEEDEREYSVELGLDMERTVRQGVIGKLIILYAADDMSTGSVQRFLDFADQQTRSRMKDTDTFSSETITRLELGWSGWGNHTVNLNLEAAYNILDNTEVEIETGSATEEIIQTPGANSRVEEVRGDFMLKDIWSRDPFEVSLNLGAEISRISQTGDENLERQFFFFKPGIYLTYFPRPGQQLQFNVDREIAQLDFNDFVSAVSFQDDQVVFGNPNLKPSNTWKSEMIYEVRFGRGGVIKFIGQYRWTNDHIDLLPLTETDGVPGNIGKARRWSFFIESTLPLDLIGLENAKVDIIARRRGMTVEDPVTGEVRVFSSNDPRHLKYTVDIDYRQDFVSAKSAWGMKLNFQANRPNFKIDEMEWLSRGTNLGVFLETSRWLGVKTRLDINNILDYNNSRERTIFQGRRDLSPVDRLRLDNSTIGTNIKLTVSGSF